MNNQSSKCMLVLSGVLLTSSAVAAEVETVYVNVENPVKRMTSLDPFAIKASPFEITPWINVLYGTNDNVANVNTNAVSSNVTIVNPNIELALKGGTQQYAVQYTGYYADYGSSSVDNYRDHTLVADAENSWSSRLNSHVQASYMNGHDARNIFLNNNSVEKWHDSAVKASVHYGAAEAQGGVELSVGWDNKVYDTDRTIMGRFDHTSRALSGTYFQRVGPATQALIQIRNTKFAYADSLSADFNSSDMTYFIGAKWDVTGTTSGTVKLGSATKTFDTGVIPSKSAGTWETDIKWLPLQYSEVDVSISRTFNEAMGVGSFVITRDQNVVWDHDLNERAKAVLTLGSATDSFEGAAREDQRKYYGLKASYGIKRWLRVGAEFKHQNRDSMNSVFTYSQNLTLATIEGSL